MINLYCLQIDVNSIHYRQDAVENLIDDEKLMFQIQTILLHFTDIERKKKRFGGLFLEILFRDYSCLYTRKSMSNSDSC